MCLTVAGDGRVKPEECKARRIGCGCGWPGCMCDAREHAQIELVESDQPAATSAPEFLNRAAALMVERAKQYDKPEGERSMARCVAAFNAITSQNLSESEGWLFMLVLKNVRLFQRPGFHQDSAEDAIAYASLLAEAKQHDQNVDRMNKRY